VAPGYFPAATVKPKALRTKSTASVIFAPAGQAGIEVDGTNTNFFTWSMGVVANNPILQAIVFVLAHCINGTEIRDIKYIGILSIDIEQNISSLTRAEFAFLLRRANPFFYGAGNVRSNALQVIVDFILYFVIRLNVRQYLRMQTTFVCWYQLGKLPDMDDSFDSMIEGMQEIGKNLAKGSEMRANIVRFVKEIILDPQNP
jgi:hypothetical protein